MNFEPYIEKFLTHFTSPQYSAEVADAKREFFEEAGILDESTASFESRMAQFLDWYIFTRELSMVHLTPVQLMVEKPPFPIDPLDLPVYEALAQARHSLFEFTKLRGRDVYCLDLFKDKKLVLKDSQVVVGFNAEEIFEGRVIPYQGNHYFTQGFCFHPPEVKKFILKEIKKVKHLEATQQEELIFRLMKMRYRHEQYRHIRVEYIYSNDSKLRV